jgi:hypothetical protein
VDRAAVQVDLADLAVDLTEDQADRMAALTDQWVDLLGQWVDLMDHTDRMDSGLGVLDLTDRWAGLLGQWAALMDLTALTDRTVFQERPMDLADQDSSFFHFLGEERQVTQTGQLTIRTKPILEQ